MSDAVDPWQKHNDDQARAWLLLTYSQRFQWLEQAKSFAQLALAAAAKRTAEKNASAPQACRETALKRGDRVLPPE